MIEELEKAKARRDYLKMVISKAQDELKKEYGEGYITRKRVKNYRYPIFRSLERGKDYNLERNFPELAQLVNEYFEIHKRIKELEAQRKKLNRFIDMAYTICVPPEVRNPKKAYKARQELKQIAIFAEAEDSLQEQCDEGDEEACEQLKYLEECGRKGFRVEGKRIICSEE
ncbi:hypothetical protein EWF20_03280 [Sulfolobus sp. S-194]|uniref:hypothetical protein n=1 Tax=Sulfolobus sp. S-194 TaxID=2512240 RepID=UPI001436EDCD|nr:hypothetical protein [Sulfolobus sp. S-194]QIW23260.1 hypothetical protein EWF20_03280 [Sulfolobus sp. S-194]